MKSIGWRDIGPCCFPLMSFGPLARWCEQHAPFFLAEDYGNMLVDLSRTTHLRPTSLAPIIAILREGESM
jgi:hypothetical protein